MHGLKEPLEGPNKETSNAELGHRHMRRGQLEEMHEMHCISWESAYWCILLSYNFTVQMHESWVGARAGGIDFSRRMLEDEDQFELNTNKQQNCKKTVNKTNL